MHAPNENSIELPVNLRLSKLAGEELAARATRTGQDVSVVASELIEEAIDGALPELNETSTTIEQRRTAWRAWVNGMRVLGLRNVPAGHVVDDSRESIYEGCGE